MEQLLAHLVGDYVLQNHWMANKKTQAWLPAVVHALFYGLPFLLLIDNHWQLAAIVGTHLLIDHYRLAQYWVDFWGTGKAGWLPSQLEQMMHARGVVPAGVEVPDDDDAFVASQLPGSAPPFLAVWLLIIVDNTAHLALNYSVLRWL